MGTRVVVTGGAGFIGSHLAERLAQEGANVCILDNFATGKLENLASVAADFELTTGDIRDPDVAMKVVTGADTVFHLAALGSVSRSVDDPTTSHHVNVDGTLNLLVAAKQAGVRRFIYSSSSSVYGDNPALPKHEGLAPQPISPYAVSKLAAEMYCRVFWKVYGLQTISLRYFNVFGPRQDSASRYAAVVPLFIDAVRHGQAPTIFGDGEQKRDFTYVANVVEANLLAMHAQDGFGQSYNIACGRNVSIRCLADTVIGLLNGATTPVYAEARTGDIRDSLADILNARQFLGYQPLVEFSEGLKRTIAWYPNVAVTEK